MIRTLAAVASLSLAGLAPANAAVAQTWGQPVYVGPYGHRVGGTPLSEVETRSYVTTGHWADGHSDQAHVLGPAPVDGVHYGYGPKFRHRRGYGYNYGYGPSGYDPGYREVQGYNDDRHRSARGSSNRHDRYFDGDCGCGDVYLYDR